MFDGSSKPAGMECKLTDLPVVFFNDTATTEIYTLSLHDALPISTAIRIFHHHLRSGARHETMSGAISRSEEHTSELQSRLHLVCRLLLEKKNRPTSSQYTRGRSAGYT